MAWWRRRSYPDFGREVEAHIALEADRLVEEEGLTPEAARAVAIRRFGNPASTREAFFDSRQVRIFDELRRDLRYALRVLRRSPAFTLVALLTMVLATGGFAIVFTLVDSILLRPLPYPESGRLVRIWQVDSTYPDPHEYRVSPADLRDLADQTTSFETIAAVRSGFVRLDGVERVRRAGVTGDFFPMLGMGVQLGRDLLPSDYLSGSPEVVVLGHTFWQVHFGGAPDVVGREVRLEGSSLVGGVSGERPVTVIGVLEPSFQLPAVRGPLRDPDIWSPLDTDSLTSPLGYPRGPGMVLDVFARLSPGTGIGAVAAEVDDVSRWLAESYPATNRTRTMGVTPLLEEVVGPDAARALWVFFGAVVCVLLIAVANLSGLQTVRNLARKHEIAVRSVLGAGRSRLVRQFLVEALLLAVSGGAIGLFAAWGGMRTLMASLPVALPRGSEVHPDSGVVLATFAVVVLAGLACGLVPALQAPRSELRSWLGEGGLALEIGPRRARLHRLLIGFETALAFVLLAGAALLTHSYWLLFNEDSGMEEEALWAVSVTYTEGQPDFWLSALEAIRVLPQVESAAWIVGGSPPLSGRPESGRVMAEGAGDFQGDDGITVSARFVSSGYFETLGIPVLRGRTILSGDTATMASRDTGGQVVVLNERLAKALWPDTDALGQRLAGGETVIGIVPDFKDVELDSQVVPQTYRPVSQIPLPLTGMVFGTALVRLNAVGARDFPAVVQRLLRGLDPGSAASVLPVSQLRWEQLAIDRFRTVVLGTFALVAVGLSLLGIFGVVAYAVVQRRREIGLRMALGAAPRDIVRLMFENALLPTLAGVGAGLAASIGLMRALDAFLFEVSPTNPETLAAACLAFLAASSIACLIPAIRAVRVDPTVALRTD